MQRFGFQPAKSATQAAPTTPTTHTDAEDTLLTAGLEAIVRDVVAVFAQRGLEPSREEIHSITLASMAASKAALRSAIETAIELGAASK